ncbi:MAG: type II toxin-antitoxin system VapC family toxin [Dehalococcoidia bacterium]|nr:type II toxin-antitoxin system VapC family toxin [Dehalococcoidia bacterium]
MAFVMDASATMAWCFEDEAIPYTEAVLERLRHEEVEVPAIWPLEVANVLLVAERRGRLTEAQTVRFTEILQALPVIVDTEAKERGLGPPILSLGRACALSAYDAAYLELAARRGLALATCDEALKSAAAQMGVPLLS